MSYSQNKEDQIIWDLIGNKISGCILEIGANDGKTFSNSLFFIENGWRAVLVEPSPRAFKKLVERHGDNPLVELHQIAITDTYGKITFYESDTHLGQGDVALVSTAVESELKRWGNSEKFEQISVESTTYGDFVNNRLKTKALAKQVHPFFDVISIDAEGFDLQILKQIDKNSFKVLCIEWNSNPQTKKEILEWLPEFKVVATNPENIILCRFA